MIEYPDESTTATSIYFSEAICTVLHSTTDNYYKFVSDLKNGGTCFDNEGTDKFSCTCRDPFVGDICEINLCDDIECKNDIACVVEVIDGIRRPTCDCPEGEICEFHYCKNGNPCYNGGICDDEMCRCREENGISKYYGESCDLTVCDGNPCQNGGACTSMIVTSNNNQVCFIKIFKG